MYTAEAYTVIICIIGYLQRKVFFFSLSFLERCPANDTGVEGLGGQMEERIPRGFPLYGPRPLQTIHRGASPSLWLHQPG